MEGETISEPKKSFFRRFWPFWGGLIILIVAVVAIVLIFKPGKGDEQAGNNPAPTTKDFDKEKAAEDKSFSVSEVPNVDPNNLPKFIQADFIDLSKVFSISRFRSGAGHDFADGTVTCASMKHYFGPQGDAYTHKDSSGMTPPPDGVSDTSIFSPVDGKIIEIQEERTPIGRQIFIRPDSQPGFTIRLFHIYLDSGFEVNSTVKAGQKIGVIGKYGMTDIAVEYPKSKEQHALVSYFDVMPDSVFANYIARGATSRDVFIITKAYRDANQLQCKSDKEGGEFINDTRDDATKELEDWFSLSGYVKPTKK